MQECKIYFEVVFFLPTFGVEMGEELIFVGVSFLYQHQQSVDLMTC
jgi:hypothetical protein